VSLDNIVLDSKVREKLDIAQYFIDIYVSSRKGLKQLGILRTERSLQADYAEWLAAQILGLKLEENPVNKGFDATDEDGNRYQIKSRIVSSLSERTSFDMKSGEQEFDYLVGVFFNRKFKVLGIIVAPYEVVKEHGRQTESRFSFRWNRRTAKDPRIRKILWKNEK